MDLVSYPARAEGLVKIKWTSSLCGKRWVIPNRKKWHKMNWWHSTATRWLKIIFRWPNLFNWPWSDFCNCWHLVLSSPFGMYLLSGVYFTFAESASPVICLFRYLFKCFFRCSCVTPNLSLLSKKRHQEVHSAWFRVSVLCHFIYLSSCVSIIAVILSYVFFFDYFYDDELYISVKIVTFWLETFFVLY